ncbi:MAG: NADP-dependent oxidoreductase [Odoribacter splanchnicus]|nr:NADP-dependent oxidoreductase [Odoribacter splanchnicus]
MKAMVLKRFGGIENFAVEDVPEPPVGDGEVLVEVKAIGIDQIDVKARKGEGMSDYLKQEHPMILGWDISGVVSKVGSRVKDFKAGDAVFGTIRFPGPGSSYAEYAAAPADQIALKPENISHAEAAAATQSPLTAWQALVDTGHVKKGDWVLVHGGAGGVGNYAIQIARHIGCYVITTVSGADRAFVKELGADEVIDYRTQAFEKEVKEVDFVLDTIGGDNFVRSLDVLKPEGMIVLLPSNKKEEADKAVREKQVKNYRHILMHSSGKDMRAIAGMLREGSMKANVDKVYSFEQIPQAQEQLENGKVRGKIVVILEK